MILYRGDQRERPTMAHLYRTDGLLTKGINGGNPAYVNIHGLMESVRAHVNPVSAMDKSFSQKSEFLSFSSNYEQAIFYASNGNPDKMVQCQNYRERRYIFTLDTDTMVPINEQNGLYQLRFKCNRKLIQPNTPNQWMMLLLQNYPCRYCITGKSFHSIILVDVVSYLRNNPHHEKYQGALENAIRDSEWLVLPEDYPHELNYQRSARIPRADIWTAEHFILSDEPLKDPEIDDLGIIINTYNE